MKGIVILLAALLIAGAGAALFLVDREMSSDPGTDPRPSAEPSDDPPEPKDLPKQAYLRDACQNLPPEWVERIRRGWTPGKARDYDLVIVPHPPNYMGSFVNTSHSAPYGFLQNVPLVLYGPGHIKPLGDVETETERTIADLAPTYAELMDFGFPKRSAESLSQVLEEDAPAPKLIFTAVIDGGGWNALNRWPDAWPNLKRLMEEGASIQGATVGSSPSITPATHTNLSTGTFPRYHGVTAIAIRANDGSLVGSFSEDAGDAGPAVMDPRVSLRKTTLADLWDKAQGNEPEIGMLAAGNLQLGMIGHGSALEGGDKDIAIVLSKEGWNTNPEFYSMPEYVRTEVPGPEGDIEAVDRADGEADGEWRGHDISPLDGSPAFAPWQNRTMQAVLEREGFGRDDVTDLFYVNYKAPDKAGHKWNMIAPEQEDVLRSVDDALGDMIEWLDENIGEDGYVFTVTADHGQTPLEAGGWPILGNEMVADIDAELDGLDNGTEIIQRTSASSWFSNKQEMIANDVTPEQVASFMSRYTIGDNIPEGEDVPAGFEDRLDERIFDAVFPGRKLPRVVACAGP